jgi:hypothetical protein
MGTGHCIREGGTDGCNGSDIDAKNIGNNGQAVLFDINDLVPGVYFVRLMAGDESIGIEKMIKE